MNDVVRRFLTLLFAAAQFALPAAASIADGIAARASGNTSAHVESVVGTHCTPAHSADCTLCRYLSGTSADIATASYCFSHTTGRQVISSADVAALSAAHFQARSRAPPMLLV